MIPCVHLMFLGNISHYTLYFIYIFGSSVVKIDLEARQHLLFTKLSKMWKEIQFQQTLYPGLFYV